MLFYSPSPCERGEGASHARQRRMKPREPFRVANSFGEGDRSPSYSYLNACTGLARATCAAWTITVAQAISSAAAPAPTK